MTDLESTLRRGLDRYAATVPVTRPPLDELLEDTRLPGHRHPARPRYVLAGAGIAAAAVAVGGFAVWRATRDEPASVSSSGACAPTTAADGVVGTGEMRDGRPWEVTVVGRPPIIVTSAMAGGEQIGGSLSDSASWDGVVNDGIVSVNLDFHRGGVVVYGDLPSSAATVEIRLADRPTVVLCTTDVPEIDVVRYFAGYLPTQARIEEIVAFDANGRRVAYLDHPERIYEGPFVEPGDRSMMIDMKVDRERVDLPLGGEEWIPTTTDAPAHINTGD